MKKLIQFSKAIFILLIILSINSVYGEEYPEWAGYPPMNAMTDVIEFNGVIYGTTMNGVFSYEPVSKEYKLYFNNHGLQASDALSIAVTSNKILVGFKYDGLMSFDPESETFEPILFPEYVDKENVLNTIALNDIFALNDSIVYIGHSKGIDRLNLNSEEIRTYSKLSVDINEFTPVTDISIVYGKIWACTSEGLVWADLDNQNLESEEEWDNYTYVGGVNCVLDFIDDSDNPSMYLGTDDNGIFEFDWTSKVATPTNISDTDIFAITEGLGTFYAASGDGLYKKSQGSWIKEAGDLSLVKVIEGTNNKIWAASDDGLKCFISSGSTEIPQMNVPRSTEIRKIDVSDNNVIWAATSYRDYGGYVLRFENEKWDNFDNISDGLPSFRTTTVTVDSRGVIWGGTWDRGVYTLNDGNTATKNDDTVTFVDTDKQILLPFSDTVSNVVIADVATDGQGNIWVAGYNRGAYVLAGRLPAKDYKYNHFTFDENSILNYIVKVFPDNEGWIWLGTWETGLIGIYIGADPFDTSDDVMKTVPYKESGDGLLGTRVGALNIDKDGYIWVGTGGGLNRITKMADKSLKVENMNENLGVTAIEVNGIEVDKDNNKWIGTSQGLMKLNDMDVLVETYDVDNSGLLSNNILSMKLDKNGEYLWIGTIKGLNRLDIANGASDSFAQQFHMYPNPFEIWGSNSYAVFNNIKSEEPIRIYNFTGEIVNELTASDNGGTTAVWNGRNFRDEYVGSGVYFFTGVDKNGSMFKEKMVVIRR